MEATISVICNKFKVLKNGECPTKEQAQLMVRNAINHAFLSETEKAELLQLAERRMN